MVRGEHLSNTLFLPFLPSPYRNKTIGDVLVSWHPHYSPVWMVVINLCGDELWETLRWSSYFLRRRLDSAVRADDVATKITMASVWPEFVPDQHLWRILTRVGVRECLSRQNGLIDSGTMLSMKMKEKREGACSFSIRMAFVRRSFPQYKQKYFKYLNCVHILYL